MLSIDIQYLGGRGATMGGKSSTGGGAGNGGNLIEEDNEEFTPENVIQRFGEIKKDYPDALVFVKVGDFLETFNNDAVAAADDLDLVLTGRSSNSGNTPMAGFPAGERAQSYVEKLTQKGWNVAVFLRGGKNARPIYFKRG